MTFGVRIALGANRMARTLLLALCAPLVTSACGATPSLPQRDGAELDYRVFLLGRDDQVAVKIPAVNKGLGTTEENLTVSFTVDELKAFLGVSHLPLSDEVLHLLTRPNCQGDRGGAHFSVRIRGALDHTIRAMVSTRPSDTYTLQANPQPMYGLSHLGFEKLSVGNNLPIAYLVLPNRAFGFRIRCGHLYSSLEGGCTVDRDAHKLVTASYSYCESLLPRWREMDDLYFTILERIIERPTLAADYRIGDGDGN
jgi:hypothetical protein